MALRAPPDLVGRFHDADAVARAEGHHLEGRRPKADLEVEQCSGLARHDPREGARLQHHGFEQQLRRLVGLHLTGRWHAARLEVEDLEAAIGATVAAVCLADEPEVAERSSRYPFALALGGPRPVAALQLE